MTFNPYFILAVVLGSAALTFVMFKAARAILHDPPIKVMVNEYRVVFTQRGWSFVTASIERRSSIVFKNLVFWRTIYFQERRFGDRPWGYSMRALSELPAKELEQLAA